MKKLNQLLMMASVAIMMSSGASKVLAQDNPPSQAERQQRMMERYQEVLEIKDDAEWKAVQPLIQKVMDARIQGFGGGRGMFGRGGGGGGGNAQGDQGGRGRGFGGPPSPEAEELQKAIDSKASGAELKAALAKYVAARKAKQAELEKAQADLRKVLSARQEAIASLNGLL